MQACTVDCHSIELWPLLQPCLLSLTVVTKEALCAGQGAVKPLHVQEFVPAQLMHTFVEDASTQGGFLFWNLLKRHTESSWYVGIFDLTPLWQSVLVMLVRTQHMYRLLMLQYNDNVAEASEQEHDLLIRSARQESFHLNLKELFWLTTYPTTGHMRDAAFSYAGISGLHTFKQGVLPPLQRCQHRRMLHSAYDHLWGRGSARRALSKCRSKLSCLAHLSRRSRPSLESRYMLCRYKHNQNRFQQGFVINTRCY